VEVPEIINWYEDFFDQTVLDFWQTVIPAETTSRNATFLSRPLAVQRGAFWTSLADTAFIPSNSHEDTPNRRRSFAGVSCQAQRRSSPRLAVEWIRQDMHRIRYSREFDACFCWGNSFGYIERDATVDLSGRCGRAQARAQFILETELSRVRPRLQGGYLGSDCDYLYLERHQYDITAGRLDVQSIVIRDGK
jgi:hypothetical protein